MKEAEVTPIITENISSRITGKIIHLNKEKGYFFVTSYAKPFTRIHVHWQSLHHTLNILNLNEGDEVSGELRQNSDGGWRLIRVDLVGK